MKRQPWRWRRAAERAVRHGCAFLVAAGAPLLPAAEEDPPAADDADAPTCVPFLALSFCTCSSMTRARDWHLSIDASSMIGDTDERLPVTDALRPRPLPDAAPPETTPPPPKPDAAPAKATLALLAGPAAGLGNPGTLFRARPFAGPP